MSYKKALTFTAVGLGAFLQGCKDDDEDAVTDCATLVEYAGLLKAEGDTAADETCLNCVHSQEGVSDDKDDTTKAVDWAAAWGKILAGSDAAAKAIAPDALEACGAKRRANACENIAVTIASNDAGEIMTQLLAASLTNVECLVSVKIGQPDTPTCASLKEGITQSGGTANFDCDAGYECVDIVDYVGEKTGGASPADVSTTCSQCLDTDAGKDFGTLVFATQGDFDKMVAALEECNAQQGDQCTGNSLAADHLDFAAMEAAVITGTTDDDKNCELCVNLYLPDSPTCDQSLTAFEACGTNVDAVTCNPCASFDTTSTDSSCSACLKAANSDVAWSTSAKPSDADLATFNDAYKLFSDCDASVDADICDSVSLSSYASDANVADIITKFETDTQANDDLPCRHCVYVAFEKKTRTTETATITCAELQEAFNACSSEAVDISACQ